MSESGHSSLSWYVRSAISGRLSSLRCDWNACQIATVDASGMPNVRTVLVKDQGTHGFVFYTNTQSAKGRELQASGKAALLYYWKSLSRQIRARGTIETVTAAAPDHRLGGSLAAHVLAALKGAAIIRTHDVAETVQAIRVTAAIGSHS